MEINPLIELCDPKLINQIILPATVLRKSKI
jgi:hypothetical protein